jgi:hypothetical protein
MKSMPSITSQQLRDYEARRYKAPKATPDATDDESELQDAIIAECRRRGWWVDYSRMDLATTRPRGAPDLYVFAHEKLLIIECKTKKGKQTPEQVGVAMMLEKLGHKLHVIRSFREFLELVNS